MGKTVSVLLTRYADNFGKLVCLMSKNKYSHASISIDENEEIFYSFNRKGFVVEKPKKYFPKLREAGSILIRMVVSDECYDKLKSIIDNFLEKKEQLKYCQFGVILCLLHISHHFENRYFCSQFVAEILEQAGVVRLNRRVSTYKPGNLIDNLEFMLCEKEILYNII